jgi:hypothetical protein
MYLVRDLLAMPLCVQMRAERHGRTAMSHSELSERKRSWESLRPRRAIRLAPSSQKMC